MKHLLIILSLFLFSFTVISCSDEKEDSTENSGTTTTTTDDTTKFVGVGNSGTIEIENGSYQKVAACQFGVGESTFYAWMEKAEGGVGGQFQELLESVKNASAVAESRAIQTILADDSWQSKAWYLERRFPERWGRKDRLEAHHTREPKVVFHTIKQMSEQEWNEMTGTETKELNSVKALN